MGGRVGHQCESAAGVVGHARHARFHFRLRQAGKAVTREDSMKLVRIVLWCFVAIWILRPSSAAVAETWPSKPVRIVNTFAPGGAADVLARTVADGLSRAFGEPFYVETHAGAGGTIGVQMVAATPPDGYNFVITN